MTWSRRGLHTRIPHTNGADPHAARATFGGLVASFTNIRNSNWSSLVAYSSSTPAAMHFTHIQGLLLAASSAAAKTITINGGNLYFDPPNVNASVGDILEFHFLPNNHSVVMGDFENVCQPAVSGGFYSGFLPAESGENVSVKRDRHDGVEPSATDSSFSPPCSKSPSTTQTRWSTTARRTPQAITIAREACSASSTSRTSRQSIGTIPQQPTVRSTLRPTAAYSVVCW